MGSRYFALISGILLALLGILGFVPNLVAPSTAPDLMVDAGYGYLLGVLPTNILFNIIRLGVGVWGIASYPSFPRAKLFARAIAIFYGVLAIMGLIPGLNTMFGLVPIFGSNVILHALTAAIGAFVGFMTPQEMSASEQAQQQRDLTGASRNR